MSNALCNWHILAGEPFGRDIGIVELADAVGRLLIERRVMMGRLHTGDHVRKKRGAEWSGYVCGFYSTPLTPEGYNVESEHHPGSVQIYPVGALELIQKLR